MEEQYKPIFESAEAPQKAKGRMGLVLVQSICCVVLVVLFWLFRVLGGEGFVALKTAFYGALENNVLMETVVGAFADRTPDQTQETVEGTTATTTVSADG